MKKIIINALRWILSLPIAIIVATLAYLILSFIIKFFTHTSENLIPFYRDSDSNRVDIFGLIFNFLLVYIGAYIAPTNKKTMALILFILTTILSLSILVGYIYIMTKGQFSFSKLWRSIFDPIFYFVGGYIAYTEIKKKDSNKTAANTSI